MSMGKIMREKLYRLGKEDSLELKFESTERERSSWKSIKKFFKKEVLSNAAESSNERNE